MTHRLAPTRVLTLFFLATLALLAGLAVPAQAAGTVDAKVRFQTSAMTQMPAEYAKKMAGMPAVSWLYVNGALRGGRVDLQVQKKGTKKWVDLASVAVPTTACKGAGCDDVYDGLRSVAPADTNGAFKRAWYTAPAPGTWAVRYRYVPGAKGNGKAVGWTPAVADGVKQSIVTAGIPATSVTVSAPASVKARKKAKVGVTVQLADPTTVFAWSQAYDGEKALKLQDGPVATVTFVPRKGKKVTLGKVRLTTYNDAKARLSGKARLKVAAPKGAGSLQVTVKGGVVAKAKKGTKALTVK